MIFHNIFLDLYDNSCYSIFWKNIKGGVFRMIGSTLKVLLEKRKLSVTELARITEIPAQTLYSIIKRDNMKIDFDVLMKICTALNVPIETFYSTSPVAESLLASEAELIRKYRELDDHGKHLVALVLEAEYERSSS